MSPTLLQVPDYTKIIAQALEFKEFQVSIVLELTAE
jgi:hypothetical protein